MKSRPLAIILICFALGAALGLVLLEALVARTILDPSLANWLRPAVVALAAGIAAVFVVGVWRREIDQYREVIELAHLTARPQRVQMTLQRGVRLAAAVTGAPAAAAYLQVESGALELAAHYGFPGTDCLAPTIPHPVSESGRPETPRRPRLFSDAQGLPKRLSDGWKEPPRYVLTVPMLHEDDLAGLLVLPSERPLVLTEADERALMALGRQLGGAWRLKVDLDRLVEAAQTDFLTGLSTRRHFDVVFRREVARARRGLYDLSIAVLDVDDLKVINDTWGHPVGDRVLEEVGKLLSQVRAGDIAARLGGDEFVLVMVGAGQNEADIVVRRIEEGLRRLNASGRLPCPVEVSVGIHQVSCLPEDPLALADNAMYRNKEARRRARVAAEQPQRRSGTND
jgi:diguanylate cyclase (GGDEF)-like protein